MSFAFLRPITGRISLFRSRSSSFHDRSFFFTFAHFSTYSSTRSPTVSAFRSAIFFVSFWVAGSMSCSILERDWLAMDRASVRDTVGYLPIVKTLFRRFSASPNRYSKKKDLRPEGSMRRPNPLPPSSKRIARLFVGLRPFILASVNRLAIIAYIKIIV